MRQAGYGRITTALLVVVAVSLALNMAAARLDSDTPQTKEDAGESVLENQQAAKPAEVLENTKAQATSTTLKDVETTTTTSIKPQPTMKTMSADSTTTTTIKHTPSTTTLITSTSTTTTIKEETSSTSTTTTTIAWDSTTTSNPIEFEAVECDKFSQLQYIKYRGMSYSQCCLTGELLCPPAGRYIMPYCSLECLKPTTTTTSTSTTTTSTTTSTTIPRIQCGLIQCGWDEKCCSAVIGDGEVSTCCGGGQKCCLNEEAGHLYCGIHC